uniref:Uncharacterized protein n=1 Tax=Arundo donax TaxID=35708 RepID=A0A0A9G2L5_ARUDO
MDLHSTPVRYQWMAWKRRRATPRGEETSAEGGRRPSLLRPVAE